MPLDPSYIEKLKKRAKGSHIYRSYQFDGLEIARLLGDEKHKALYIRLAKERDVGELRRIAKTVSERQNVKNRAAYFMSQVAEVPRRRKIGPPALPAVKKQARKPGRSRSLSLFPTMDQPKRSKPKKRSS